MNFFNVVLAFFGGVFGAVIGGTTSFIFTGFFALLGIVLLIATGNSILMDNVAFGAFFGPHISFVGGVAAAALSGSKKRTQNDIDTRYTDGADTTIPLFEIEDISILLVGGVFGVGGYLVNKILLLTAIQIDTIATAVVILGILSRLLISRANITGDYSKTIINGSKLLFTFLWGAAVSMLTAHIIILILSVTGESIPTFGWAMSAVSLIFLYTNISTFPVSHHITINAGYFSLATGNIWIGTLAGAISGILGLYIEKYTNTGVKSHLDMPAVVIAIGSFISFTLIGN